MKRPAKGQNRIRIQGLVSPYIYEKISNYVKNKIFPSESELVNQALITFLKDLEDEKEKTRIDKILEIIKNYSGYTIIKNAGELGDLTGYVLSEKIKKKFPEETKNYIKIKKEEAKMKKRK